MAFALKSPPLNVKLEIIVPQQSDLTFTKLSPQQYYELLTELAAQGEAASKKSNIIAFPLFKLGIVTLGREGNTETIKDLPLDHHLVFDASLYSIDQAKKAVTKVFASYGELITTAPADLIAMVNKGELDIRVAASAEGIWTVANKNFKADYEPDAEIKGMYHAKPGTGRLCLNVGQNFNMPVQWGDFSVPEGGTIAVRFEDVPALVKALDDVRDGKATIENALYGDKGVEGPSRFDIYGMYQGFYGTNYEPTRITDAAFNALSERQGIGGGPHYPGSPQEADKLPGLRRLLGGAKIAPK